MKMCTDKERMFLDLIIGQPMAVSYDDGKRIIELMNDIRIGNDAEPIELSEEETNKNSPIYKSDQLNIINGRG